MGRDVSSPPTVAWTRVSLRGPDPVPCSFRSEGPRDVSSSKSPDRDTQGTQVVRWEGTSVSPECRLTQGGPLGHRSRVHRRPLSGSDLPGSSWGVGWGDGPPTQGTLPRSWVLVRVGVTDLRPEGHFHGP